MFPTPENGGRGQVEAGPHHDLPQVVGVLNHAPQAVLDKLPLQTDNKQVNTKINRSRTNGPQTGHYKKCIYIYNKGL